MIKLGKRIPVRYKNIVLMPMLSCRAGKLIKNGKAKLCYAKKLKTHYVELCNEPSGFNTQEVVVGIDPGSVFDGITVLSKKCHHINIELIQRSKKGKTSIKAFKKTQSQNRRVRRSRLRHRKARFDNRTSLKLVPTIRANVDFRKWIIEQLNSLFPITKVVVEDVSFDHYRKWKGGASFSHVEVGKEYFYRFIKEKFSLEKIKGYETSQLRTSHNGGIDPKPKGLETKGDKTFNAHCYDSFVISAGKGEKIDFETGEVIPIVLFEGCLNKDVIFIQKGRIARNGKTVAVPIRRLLHRTKSKIKEKGKFYRLRKGGVKEFYIAYSRKKAICRVKTSVHKSNHGDWEYIDNGFAVKSKQFKTNYGGTINLKTGVSKAREASEHEYINRVVHIIKEK